MTNKITPFLKWAGGKRQLVKEIKKRMPQQFNDFYEPFVGGGALFIELQNNKTLINDYSKELIDAYLTIKEKPNELMELLDKHEVKHQENPKEYYYQIRELDRKEEWNKESKLVKTARMIYLNKAGFNGLYRVNKKGYFNVPFNQKKKVITYNQENILSLSKFLNSNVVITSTDFAKAVKNAKKGDFIFFDPPYDLLKKDTFDGYNPIAFGVEGQKRLAKIAHELSDRGCYVMITNHDTPLINEIYNDFNIDVVSAKRMINSDSKNRSGLETIIYNYPLEDKDETKL